MKSRSLPNAQSAIYNLKSDESGIQEFPIKNEHNRVMSVKSGSCFMLRAISRKNSINIYYLYCYLRAGKNVIFTFDST